MLKLAQEGSDNEKIALLQSLLEDANRRKNELETENRSVNTHSPAALSSKYFSTFESHISSVDFRFHVLDCSSVSNLISHKEFLCVQSNVSEQNRSQPQVCFISHCIACSLIMAHVFLSRLINQRLMEEQGQVEELQKSLDEQGSKADDVSNEYI